ncbi:MAG TPA: (Fe-S)-binding protein, partial [Candidatus Hydrogenedentes bacterium]|nr:(Fe-S)-binding protein [Candidatus Hydrogenedentota bacterium]
CARYFLPHSRPNFRTHAIARFADDERAAIEDWQRLDPVDEIFYPGCNVIASPYLTFSRLFEGIIIRGGLEYCCGEMYFRMGLYDQVEQVARKLTEYFRKLGVKRVYGSCTACLNVLSNILPQFGADFGGIEFVSSVKRLHDQLASGALPITHPLDQTTVTVQDPCHAKVCEEEYYEWPRRILEMIGCRIVEAPQNRQTALCCGIGSGFSHGAAYGKRDIIVGQRACAANLRAASAQRIAVYCSGCLQTQSTAKYVSWTREPVYHLIELVQEATGETPARRHRKLAFDLLSGTLFRQEVGKERFFVPPIA